MDSVKCAVANGRYHFLAPEEQDPEDEASAAVIWAGMRQNTTAHGIPHIDKARGTCKPKLPYVNPPSAKYRYIRVPPESIK